MSSVIQRFHCTCVVTAHFTYISKHAFGFPINSRKQSLVSITPPLYLASFPGLPCFVLRFAFSIIHESGRAQKRALPLPCIILNANQRTKNGGGLGTRLLSSCNNLSTHSRSLFLYPSSSRSHLLFMLHVEG